MPLSAEQANWIKAIDNHPVISPDEMTPELALAAIKTLRDVINRTSFEGFELSGSVLEKLDEASDLIEFPKT